MVTLNSDMIFFVLVLLESEDIITEEQRKSMMKTVWSLERNIPLRDASSRILDIIKEKK